jgi:hypothetical protein
MNKTLLGLGALVLLAGGVAMSLPSMASAYRSDPNVKGPNYTAERHMAMEAAFEKNDYNAWKNLMQGRDRVTQVVTKDNFSKFAQIHKLTEEGKTAEAQKIRQEMGLGLKNGMGQGMGMGRNCGR